MISNHLNYNINGKQLKIREISFTEYKNLCKKLFTDDVNELQAVFNEILSSTVIGPTLNCVEKFYCLLLIRNLLYGNEFAFQYNGINTTMDLKTILNAFKFTVNDVVVTDKNVEYHFNIPDNLYNPTIDKVIADSLKKVVVPTKEIECSTFSYEEKLTVINNSNIPLQDTFNKLQNQFRQLNIPFIKDIEIDIITGTLLGFLKRVFNDNIGAIYNFEYVCIRSLNFGANDFDKYTLPELKIFLNSLKSEQSKSNNGQDS